MKRSIYFLAELPYDEKFATPFLPVSFCVFQGIESFGKAVYFFFRSVLSSTEITGPDFSHIGRWAPLNFMDVIRRETYYYYDVVHAYIRRCWLTITHHLLMYRVMRIRRPVATISCAQALCRRTIRSPSEQQSRRHRRWTVANLTSISSCGRWFQTSCFGSRLSNLPS